jgi:Carboxypeptidase regulatory-like domain
MAFLLKRLTWAAVLGCTLVGAALAWKQNKQNFDTKTRTVFGVVKEPGGQPASGAVVLLKDAKTLQIRSYVTKDDGVYRFLGLSANDEYALQAQKQGTSSKPKTLSQFDSRNQAKIDLQLK